jgi:hypothetical protein
MASTGLRALDRLKKAANMELIKKTIILSNSDEFEFWHKPLTMSERDRARKQGGSSDPQDWMLPLMVIKCLDETGSPMFQAGQIDELKNEVRDTDLQKIILAMIGDEAKDLEVGK